VYINTYFKICVWYIYIYMKCVIQTVVLDSRRMCASKFEYMYMFVYMIIYMRIYVYGNIYIYIFVHMILYM